MDKEKMAKEDLEAGLENAMKLGNSEADERIHSSIKTALSLFSELEILRGKLKIADELNEFTKAQNEGLLSEITEHQEAETALKEALTGYKMPRQIIEKDTEIAKLKMLVEQNSDMTEADAMLLKDLQKKIDELKKQVEWGNGNYNKLLEESRAKDKQITELKTALTGYKMPRQIIDRNRR